MVKGCKFSIHVPSDEVTRLEKSKGKILLEARAYEDNGKKDSKTGATIYEYAFKEVFNEAVKKENDCLWTYIIDAQQIKDDGNVNKGDTEIDYGQRWIVDGDRETEQTNPVDDKDAPKRGFIFANSFDNVELTLTPRQFQNAEMFLGKFNKGNHKVIPKVVFRVTIASGEEHNSFEIQFAPRDPTDKEPHFTQSVTYKPATLG